MWTGSKSGCVRVPYFGTIFLLCWCPPGTLLRHLKAQWWEKEVCVLVTLDLGKEENTSEDADLGIQSVWFRCCSGHLLKPLKSGKWTPSNYFKGASHTSLHILFRRIHCKGPKKCRRCMLKTDPNPMTLWGRIEHISLWGRSKSWPKCYAL